MRINTLMTYEGNKILATIGTAIRDERMKQTMTRNELARKARVSRTTIVLLEAGAINPTVETVERIAKALGLSICLN